MADRGQSRAGRQHVVGQQGLPGSPSDEGDRADALGRHASRIARDSKGHQCPDKQQQQGEQRHQPEQDASIPQCSHGVIRSTE